MTKSIENIKENLKEAYIKLKKYGYIFGILMVCMGVLIFLRPIATSSFFIWVLIFGVLFNAISKLIAYASLPKELRNGWHLALGILWLIALIILIADACNLPIQSTISIKAFAGLMIGFNCIISGISSICSSGQVKENGGSAGLVILSGIIEICCGAAVIGSPVFGFYALTVAFGLYLTIMGASLIIRAIAY